mmetsp:Transcript_14445/g.27176  ORF Transcript_14445/g.27176 Transcript_14445/m.27176 type:complete len:84 (+) Transcript_14445:3330-3581(+)
MRSTPLASAFEVSYKTPSKLTLHLIKGIHSIYYIISNISWFELCRRDPIIINFFEHNFEIFILTNSGNKIGKRWAIHRVGDTR